MTLTLHCCRSVSPAPCGRLIAEITQHIPEPRAQPIRYYGYYSNKSRGMRAKATAIANAEQKDESDPANNVTHRQARSRWAALIKRVYG
ncbi:MAG: transposase [Lentisphaeria bacterium]|nr:transposase [Lentisphaeria bacterium]